MMEEGKIKKFGFCANARNHPPKEYYHGQNRQNCMRKGQKSAAFRCKMAKITRKAGKKSVPPCIFGREIVYLYSDKKEGGGSPMKSVNIKLNLMTDGAKFVQIVGAYPYDMDLRSGRHVVDAKSILGIFSLDWSKPVTMEIYSDDCDDLLAEIKPFLA
jgi:phosphocarrier protein HPr